MLIEYALIIAFAVQQPQPTVTIVEGQRDGQAFPVEIGLFPRKFKGRKYCLANVVRLDKQI